MNCVQAEQLFDAYLDGQLGGSLRLEFDAHRLRCRRCQQTLAMLESVGTLIATDSVHPPLSPDFTDRVMARIAHRSAQRRRPLRRLLLVAGAVSQAAAVLAFVLYWLPPKPRPPAQPAPAAPQVPLEYANSPEFRAIRELVVDRVERRLWEMHHAGTQLTSDLVGLARYLNISLPADVARESLRMAGANPWQALWDAFLPRGEEETETPPATDELHSI